MQSYTHDVEAYTSLFPISQSLLWFIKYLIGPYLAVTSTQSAWTIGNGCEHNPYVLLRLCYTWFHEKMNYAETIYPTFDILVKSHCRHSIYTTNCKDLYNENEGCQSK